MPKPIEVLSTIAELRRWRQTITGRVGLVPTMGALHDGHAALLRKLRPRCDVSVLTIFVNPTQFGPKEDLARYPRTLERDLEIARAEGVDAVFTPTPDEIYPEGYSTYVEETEVSRPLCGEFRPGHFRGVTTVVLKLFNLIRPELALFGLKDAQQFFVLHRMASDLNLEIEIEGMQTVREESGLALSSRNAYLSAESRERAPLIYQALHRLAVELRGGGESVPRLEREKKALTQAGFKVQYLDCRRLPDLAPALTIEPGVPHLIAVAAYLGETRLIDNVILWPERLRAYGIAVEKDRN